MGKHNIKQLISRMTLDEKVSLCSGMDSWNTKKIKRLNIPPITMADGPHGLRKQNHTNGHLGEPESKPSTCFPSSVGLASTWNRNLIKEVGKTLGKEAQAEGVSILLGPGVNIKRSPLCGRNFEYFSEDPCLSSEMAASYIKGVQGQGVGASIKHFAVNNQEHRRMSLDVVIDERSLREIYLASFEGAIKQSQPWTVMSSYNKVNGTYASENPSLLNNILKKEWGFEGFVLSDWGAVNERDKGLASGLELEMPSSSGVGAERIKNSIKNGELLEETLNLAVEKILTILFKAVEQKRDNASFEISAHHILAKKAAKESMVLLKNENNVLPLKKEGKVALIGAFAKEPRYQGSGSSRITPTKLENSYEEIKRLAGNKMEILYAQGYHLENDDVDEQLIQEAKEISQESNISIIFSGLPDRYESEGFDRKHLNIPTNHSRLIEGVTEVQNNVIVVFSNGAPIEMPWINQVEGILEAYLGGQASGGAIAELLFGITSPSGKLAETFPEKLNHNPSYLNFPGEGDKVKYEEGLFIGYRYYDKKKIKPLFPFGHGLSYTEFDYSDLTISKKEFKADENIYVKFKLKNIGEMTGKEIVQLYIKDVKSTVIRPIKELKDFQKIELRQGEETYVKFYLNKRSFAYYNVTLKDWHVESGEFEILIGKSSQDLVLKKTVYVISDIMLEKKYHRNSTVGDLMNDSNAAPIVQQVLRDLKGKSRMIDNFQNGDTEMLISMMKDMPLRVLVLFSQGAFSEEKLERVIQKLNG